MLLIIILALSINLYSQDGLVKTLYPNGVVESEINFKDGVREGESKFYYDNSNLKEEINYSNGRVEGFVKIYSETGKLKETFVIEDGRREGPTSLFDEDGNYLTDIYFENGKLVTRTVTESNVLALNRDSEKSVTEEEQVTENTKPRDTKKKKANTETLLPPEIEEEKLENDPAFFATVEVMPEPVGGMEAIYRKLIYPSEARTNEIAGTVIIKALIDEFGEVNDAQVIQSVGYGCDDVARNAVYFAKFKPGLLKGKPVRVMMSIPIKFNPLMKQN